METLVRLIAPRNAVDFIGKAILIILVIGLMNYARDVYLGSDGHDDYLNNLTEAALVGTPFTVFALYLVGYLRSLQLKLARLAATDLLTGLPNRRAFFAAAEARRRAGHCNTLMMIDADHFKRINDDYGHHIGDLCLQELADVLRAAFRKDDLIARLGGEEFAALLFDVTPHQATPIASRIARGVTIHPDPAVPPIDLTFSVGMAQFDAACPLETGFQRADAALYQAKADGRACVRMAPEERGLRDCPGAIRKTA